MLNWFSAASTLVKVAVLGGFVLIVVVSTAISTAFIVSGQGSTENGKQVLVASSRPTNSALQHSNSTSTPSATPSQSSDQKADPNNPVTKQESPTKSIQSLPVEPEPVPEAGPSVPSAPLNFQTGGGGCYSDGTTSFCGISFTFTPPASDGGAPITSYIASYSLDAGATWQTTGAQYQPSYSSWETTPVAGVGIPRLWFIQAVNSAGISPASNQSGW